MENTVKITPSSQGADSTPKRWELKILLKVVLWLLRDEIFGLSPQSTNCIITDWTYSPKKKLIL